MDRQTVVETVAKKTMAQLLTERNFAPTGKMPLNVLLDLLKGAVAKRDSRTLFIEFLVDEQEDQDPAVSHVHIFTLREETDDERRTRLERERKVRAENWRTHARADFEETYFTICDLEDKPNNSFEESIKLVAARERANALRKAFPAETRKLEKEKEKERKRILNRYKTAGSKARASA